MKKVRLAVNIIGDPTQRTISLRTTDAAWLYVLARAELALMHLVQQREEWEFESNCFEEIREIVDGLGHQLTAAGLVIEHPGDKPVN